MYDKAFLDVGSVEESVTTSVGLTRLRHLLG